MSVYGSLYLTQRLTMTIFLWHTDKNVTSDSPMKPLHFSPHTAPSVCLKGRQGTRHIE